MHPHEYDGYIGFREASAEVADFVVGKDCSFAVLGAWALNAQRNDPLHDMRPQGDAILRLPEDHTPLLLVTVDTEAEFDWSLPLSRNATSVRSVRYQTRAHAIFERYRIRPTYLVDYAVATQEDGYKPLVEILADDQCVIGAHLQPWENPPFVEDIAIRRNSYVGNLPAQLEREKLLALKHAIQDSFNLTPRVYRAGRFAVGPHTAATLLELGFEIDTSVVPHTDFSREDGPDFTGFDVNPYWCGRGRQLFEIPLTVGFTGIFRQQGPAFARLVFRPECVQLHVPGIMARFRLLDRIRLSPEGIEFGELRRLVRQLLKAGHRIFSFTYHSPSLEPGNTAYVRNDRELRSFLDRFERFFDFFFGEAGGRAVTPIELRAIALQLRMEGASIQEVSRPPTLSGMQA